MTVWRNRHRIRLTKSIGFVATALALAAATVALSVSSASAEEASPEFTSEIVTMNLTGSGPQKGHENYLAFSNEGGKQVMLKCTKMTSLTTSLTMPNASIVLQPEYTGCTIGTDKATVKREGCTFQFTLVLGSNPPTATMNLGCAGKNEFTIETATCTIHIPPQNGLSHALFSNTGMMKKREVDATLAVSSLKYTITAGCPGQTKNVTAANGTITEEVLLRGDSPFEQRGFWVA